MNNTITQEAFSVMREMAALSATPGISEENIKLANQHITTLLNKIVKPAIDELSLSNSGLIKPR